MFEALRTLFAPKPVEPEPTDGKITLADVLRRDWVELWYQPKIDLRTRRLVGAERRMVGGPRPAVRQSASAKLLRGLFAEG